MVYFETTPLQSFTSNISLPSQGLCLQFYVPDWWGCRP